MISSGLSGGRVAERPVGSPIMAVKSPIIKIAVWPRSWKCFSLRINTVWPRCRSGAVGSNPALTRSGLPDCRDRSSRSPSSVSRMISAEPFFMYVICSSTGAKFGMLGIISAGTPIDGIEQRSSPGARGSEHESSAYDPKLPIQHQIDGLCISNVLLFEDSGRQRVLIVAFEHRDGSLHDDRPVIQFFIHEMDRAAGDFYSIGKSLLLGFKSGKGR